MILTREHLNQACCNAVYEYIASTRKQFFLTLTTGNGRGTLEVCRWILNVNSGRPNARKLYFEVKVPSVDMVPCEVKFGTLETLSLEAEYRFNSMKMIMSFPEPDTCVDTHSNDSPSDDEADKYLFGQDLDYKLPETPERISHAI